MVRFERRILLAVPALAAGAALWPAGNGGMAEAAAQKGQPASLCEPDETVVFECRTGNQLAALCGRRAPARQLRYLFGRPGQIEYASPPDTRFRSEPGLRTIDIRFRDGQDEYSIYRTTVTGFSADGRYEPASIDGVRVMRGEQLISDRRCAGEARSRGALEDYTPQGE
jgi:hypothetical protein